MNTHRDTSGMPPGGSQQTGLITASAACLLVAAVLVGGYALWQRDALLGGLGLQLSLSAMSVLATWHAIRLRQGFSTARDSAESSRASLPQRRSSRWGDEDEYEADAEHLRQALQEDTLHDRNVHFLLLEVGPALVSGVIAIGLLARTRVVEEAAGHTEQLVFGLLCLAVSCVWIVLARSFEAFSAVECPDARKLGMQLRETQWASLLGAAALLGSLLWAPLEMWVARLLAIWIVAICVEQLIRAVLAWRQAFTLSGDPIPSYPLAIRQSLLVHGNPLTSLFESFERRFGVSFRSSWTIWFVRRAFLPILLLSGCLVLGPDEPDVDRAERGRVTGEFWRGGWEAGIWLALEAAVALWGSAAL